MRVGEVGVGVRGWGDRVGDGGGGWELGELGVESGGWRRREGRGGEGWGVGKWGVGDEGEGGVPWAHWPVSLAESESPGSQ